MSLVNILNVQVLKNPAKFSDPFIFEITFECLAALEQDLEWKIVFVGSAESDTYDQTLDLIMVGPVPVGINKFVFQANAPNPDLIPLEEIRGVTVVLLICSYLDQEFVRIGYYVDNDFEEEELRENPPENIRDPTILALLKRNILADKPRVTRFSIKWDLSKLNEEEDITELLNIKVDEDCNSDWTESEGPASADACDEDESDDDDQVDTETDLDTSEDSFEQIDAMSCDSSRLPSEGTFMEVDH